MAIRSDSYSSLAEVAAFTAHLLDGQASFNSTTRPTKTQIDKFIDRASGLLNLALATGGFTPANVRANSTAKLACDDWVTNRAVEYTELTQRGTGHNSDDGSRTDAFRTLNEQANDFVKVNSLGFVRLGVTQTNSLSQGLTFTGLDAQANRSDPSDTSIEQPKFTRGQWENEED